MIFVLRIADATIPVGFAKASRFVHQARRAAPLKGGLSGRRTMSWRRRSPSDNCRQISLQKKRRALSDAPLQSKQADVYFSLP
jgi:hypothetical protein